MSTALKINSINMKAIGNLAGQNQEDPTGPINFVFAGLFNDTTGQFAAEPFNITVPAGTKLPGGTGVFGPRSEDERKLDLTREVVIYRLCRLSDIPKLVHARVMDHSYGTRTLSLHLIIPCKVITPDDAKKDHGADMRVFALTNPPIDISERVGVQIVTEPCPNDGDLSLQFSMIWPLPKPKDPNDR